VVPKGDSLKHALTLAHKAAGQSPDAIKACKRLLTAPREKMVAQGLSDERTEFVKLIGEPNQLEGTNAFLEKRNAEWQ